MECGRSLPIGPFSVVDLFCPQLHLLIAPRDLSPSPDVALRIVALTTASAI